MFNFTSLAAVIGTEDDKKDDTMTSSHIENVVDNNPYHRIMREGSGESSIRAPQVLEGQEQTPAGMEESTATILPGHPLQPVATHESNQYDAKHFGDVSLLETLGHGTNTAH